MHDLFLTFQALWLDAWANPIFLYVVRTICGTLAFLAAAIGLLNAIRPNRLEGMWGAQDCRVDQVITWLMAIGMSGLTAYFLLAGLFESERTSAPGRLLFLDLFLCLITVAVLLHGVAKRARYSRKRAATPGKLVR